MWQDQVVHVAQPLLVTAVFLAPVLRDMHDWPALKSSVFLSLWFAYVATVYTNVYVGYICWGKACHEFFVNVSFSAGVGSGLHVAIGASHKARAKVAFWMQVVMGTNAAIFFFVFRAYNWVLVYMAISRFFELYFIAGHLPVYFDWDESGLRMVRPLPLLPAPAA